MQTRYNTAVASSIWQRRERRVSELCISDPLPGYLKCAGVLCTTCAGNAADWRDTEREMSPEKRILVSLIVPWRVELLKGPQFGGTQNPKRKEKLVSIQSGRGGMSKHCKATASGCTVHRMGRGRTSSPPNACCYITSVSRRDTLRVRRVLWHPPIIQWWLYRPVHAQAGYLSDTEWFLFFNLFFCLGDNFQIFILLHWN